MKKNGLYLAVSILTLFLGVGVVWICRKIDLAEAGKFTDVPLAQQNSDSNEKTKKTYPTSSDGKVKVDFIKFGSSKDNSIVEFRVTNFNTQTAFYWANSYDEENEAASPYPQFKINGIKEDVWYCGTGLKEFELKSGESKTFKVGGQHLNYYLGKANESVQIGYWFSFRESKEGELFWSEKFQISETVKSQLEKEELELKKRNQ